MKDDEKKEIKISLGSNYLNNLDISKLIGNYTKALSGLDTSRLMDNYTKVLSGLDTSRLLDNYIKALSGLNTSKFNQSTWKGILEPLESILNERKSEIREIDFDSIEVNKDGTINYKNQLININDNIEIINSFFTAILSFPQNLANIFLKFKTLHPIAFFLFIFLIFSPIQERYNEFANKIINEAIQRYHLTKLENVAVKKGSIINSINDEVIKRVNQENVRKEIFNNYRIVFTEYLNVRSGQSIKTKIIAKLHLGQLVRIIRKERNWSLIEYTDEDCEICIRGWVFTRYLKRFD